MPDDPVWLTACVFALIGLGLVVGFSIGFDMGAWAMSRRIRKATDQEDRPHGS